MMSEIIMIVLIIISHWIVRTDRHVPIFVEKLVALLALVFIAHTSWKYSDLIVRVFEIPQSFERDLVVFFVVVIVSVLSVFIVLPAPKGTEKGD
jgi:hypothetical protein